MIDKLTKQQEEMMLVIRDKWLDKMFGGFKEIDEEKATKGIEWLYEISGLEKPKAIFVMSPLGAQLAANILGGKEVRSQVRNQVWDQVRDQVGSQVWGQVWGQVRSQVRSQVWDQVRDQVWGQVWGQVWDQVRDQVGSQVWGQVRSQVWGQVESQVRGQVWGQVRSQVWGQGLDFFYFAYYGSVWDYGWVAYIEFFEQLGVVKHNDFARLMELLDSNIYDMIQLEKFCIVCEKPDFISRDEEHRLHNEERSAIHWRDTYEQFYLFGVYFEKELWEKVVGKTLSFKEIMAIENMEQRMVALKMMNPVELLEETEAKLLDKSERGNELYLITGLFDTPAYFLKYSCPSTGRIYISGIDPDIARENPRADAAMAWKHNMTEEEYSLLEIEA